METVWLHLHDEAPRIGSGRRRVEVVTRGRKWVTVKYRPGGPDGHTIRHRFKKGVFETLVKTQA